jgi:hypothetical protein
MKRLYVKLALALFFITFFCVGVSEAQGLPDFSRWNGTLWKISTTAKGYYFSDAALPNPPDTKVRGTETQWGTTTADISGTFSIDIYEESDTGSCSPVETLNLIYFSGSALDFVARFSTGPSSPDSNYITGLVRVMGTLNRSQTTVQTGKIEPLGGYSLEYDLNRQGDLSAFKIDVKGTKVSKLGCTN